jgi:hypothetical protein
MSVLAAAVGCTSDDGPVGNIDYLITGLANDGATLHIGADGAATRSIPDGGTLTTVLDQSTLADLHAEIEAAQFPDLAPLYACTGLCPQIATSILHVTVQLGDHSYTSAADSLFLSVPGKVPSGLVTTIDTLAQTFEHADWH